MSTKKPEDHSPARDQLPDETLALVFFSVIVGVLLGVALWAPVHHVSGGDPNQVASRAETANAIVGAFESLAVIGGIGAAAFWFYRRRQHQARLVWGHTITHHQLTDGTVWLNLQISVTNQGEILARIPRVITRVQQVLPLHGDIAHLVDRMDRSLFEEEEISWPTIRESDERCTLEVEPSETTTLERDFLLPAELDTVVVYTFVPNPMKQDSGIGWPTHSIYSLNNNPRSGVADHDGEGS